MVNPVSLATRSQAINRWRERMYYALQKRHNSESFSLIIHALHNISEETFYMARKIAEDKGKKKVKAEFNGFVNIELSVEQKAEAKEWLRDVEAVQVELDDILASGYKVTIVKSEATGGYQSSAFCTDDKSPNAGYILSAFAPSWYDALCMLAYKHAIIAEGIWPIGETNRDLWG